MEGAKDCVAIFTIDTGTVTNFSPRTPPPRWVSNVRRVSRRVPFAIRCNESNNPYYIFPVRHSTPPTRV